MSKRGQIMKMAEQLDALIAEKLAAGMTEADLLRDLEAHLPRNKNEAAIARYIIQAFLRNR